MRYLHTFDSYLRYQNIDALVMPADMLTIWRGAYESAKNNYAAHDVHSMFRGPPRDNEPRHAIAVEDAGKLWLALCIQRSPSGYYILIPHGATAGNPHASYHRDGRYHQKTGNHKFGVQMRQPLDQFRGSEHLGSFGPIGPGAAICNPLSFNSVLKVPLDGRDPMKLCALVDLVEPGGEPAAHHRNVPGLQVLSEATYRECSPWVFVATAERA